MRSVCTTTREQPRSVQFSCSVVSDSASPWTARQASLSITNSWSLLKLTSIELVMPSNHLILCRSLLLLLSIFPSIRVFSNESVLCIREPPLAATREKPFQQWRPNTTKNKLKKQTEKEPMIERQLSPKKIYKWPISIWENTQVNIFSLHIKKPQWDTTSHPLEWL